MQDQVSYELAQQEFKNDQLEKKWLASLPTRRDYVVELAKKIMNGEVDSDTYHFAFNEWYRDAYEDYSKEFIDTLASHEKGLSVLIHSGDYWALLNNITLAALEAATYFLYETDVEDILSDGYSLHVLISEVQSG